MQLTSYENLTTDKIFFQEVEEFRMQWFKSNCIMSMLFLQE